MLQIRSSRLPRTRKRAISTMCQPRTMREASTTITQVVTPATQLESCPLVTLILGCRTISTIMITMMQKSIIASTTITPSLRMRQQQTLWRRKKTRVKRKRITSCNRVFTIQACLQVLCMSLRQHWHSVLRSNLDRHPSISHLRVTHHRLRMQSRQPLRTRHLRDSNNSSIDTMWHHCSSHI